MSSKEKFAHDASKVANFLTTDPIEFHAKVNQSTRDLLSKYSRGRAEEIVEHVVALVRNLYAVAFVVLLFACLITSVMIGK